ncbi:MAG: translation elongation factor Ts [Candidatus Portnoybacteria bacterium]|nr:translation elongation factor Ts [Candidatus Portnoybacteria bacterium]
MAITAQQVKELRDKTQASMADCKKALEEANGDLKKALELLQRRGKQIAEKRAEREVKAGIVSSYIHPNNRLGVLVELNCETDFVAKTEMFRELAHELAMQIAAMSPQYVAVENIPVQIIEKEKAKHLDEFKSSGKPEKIVGQIIEGKIKKFSEEICLLEQPYVKNPDQKIKDLLSDYIGKIGENIKIGRFVRIEI